MNLAIILCVYVILFGFDKKGSRKEKGKGLRRLSGVDKIYDFDSFP